MTSSCTRHYFEVCRVVCISNSFLFTNTFMHMSMEVGGWRCLLLNHRDAGGAGPKTGPQPPWVAFSFPNISLKSSLGFWKPPDTCVWCITDMGTASRLFLKSLHPVVLGPVSSGQRPKQNTVQVLSQEPQIDHLHLMKPRGDGFTHPVVTVSLLRARYRDG